MRDEYPEAGEVRGSFRRNTRAMSDTWPLGWGQSWPLAGLHNLGSINGASLQTGVRALESSHAL